MECMPHEFSDTLRGLPPLRTSSCGATQSGAHTPVGTPVQRCEPTSPLPAGLFDVRQALVSPSIAVPKPGQKQAQQQQNDAELGAPAKGTAAGVEEDEAARQPAPRPRRPSSVRALQLVQSLGEDSTDPDFSPRQPSAAKLRGSGGSAGGARGGPSRYRGVVWHKSNSKWEARIYEGGKQKFLGYFTDEDAAAQAYDEYAWRLHGNLHKLNFPQRYASECAAARPAAAGDAAATSASCPPLVPAAAPAGRTAAEAAAAPAPAPAAAGGRQQKRGGGGGGGSRPPRVQPVKGSSRFRGVSWNSNCGKWRAQVWKGSEVHHLGYFEDEVAAAHAYDAAVLRIRGPEAPTNFPASTYATAAAAAAVASPSLPARLAQLRAAAPAPAPAVHGVASAALLPGREERQQEGQGGEAARAGSGGSGLYGVSWCPRRRGWLAEIWDGSQFLLLGAFASETEAGRAYDLACLEQHGTDALTNHPVSSYEAELAAVALTSLSRGLQPACCLSAVGGSTTPSAQPTAAHQQAASSGRCTEQEAAEAVAGPGGTHSPAAAEAAADSKDGDLPVAPPATTAAQPAPGSAAAQDSAGAMAAADAAMPAASPHGACGAVAPSSAAAAPGSSDSGAGPHSSHSSGTTAREPPACPAADVPAAAAAAGTTPAGAQLPDAHTTQAHMPSAALAAQGAASGRRGVSCYMGVSWDRRKHRWFSQIQQHGRRRFLGYFFKQEEAARAYDRATLKLNGPQAAVNFADSAVAADDSSDACSDASHTKAASGSAGSSRAGSGTSSHPGKQSAVLTRTASDAATAFPPRSGAQQLLPQPGVAQSRQLSPAEALRRMAQQQQQQQQQQVMQCQQQAAAGVAAASLARLQQHQALLQLLQRNAQPGAAEPQARPPAPAPAQLVLLGGIPALWPLQHNTQVLLPAAAQPAAVAAAVAGAAGAGQLSTGCKRPADAAAELAILGPLEHQPELLALLGNGSPPPAKRSRPSAAAVGSAALGAEAVASLLSPPAAAASTPRPAAKAPLTASPAVHQISAYAQGCSPAGQVPAWPGMPLPTHRP